MVSSMIQKSQIIIKTSYDKVSVEFRSAIKHINRDAHSVGQLINLDESSVKTFKSTMVTWDVGVGAGVGMTEHCGPEKFALWACVCGNFVFV